MKSRRDAQRAFQAPTLQPSTEASKAARKLANIFLALDTFAARREQAGWDAAIKALDTPDDALIEAMGNAIGISLGDAHWEPQSESYEWVKEHGEEARAALRAAVDHILGRKP